MRFDRLRKFCQMWQWNWGWKDESIQSSLCQQCLDALGCPCPHPEKYVISPQHAGKTFRLRPEIETVTNEDEEE